MHPVKYHLTNKLTWMARQLRQKNNAADVTAWVSAMHTAYNLLVVLSGNEAILKDEPHCERSNTESMVSNVVQGKRTGVDSKVTTPLEELAETPTFQIDDTPSVTDLQTINISPMKDNKEIVMKAQKADEIIPTKRRHVVKGVRTSSRMAPSHTVPGTLKRDDKNYGPVLQAGKQRRELCREYLKRWLREKGEDYRPFKGEKRKNEFKLEILLRDFGEHVKIDNGRSCKVFRDFVSKELRLLYYC